MTPSSSARWLWRSLALIFLWACIYGPGLFRPSLFDDADSAHAEAGRGVAVAQIGCAVLVASVFLPWLYQARANLRALGARRLRFSREWTYLGFAIPVLNAYRPYQVVSEVWRGSDPSSLDPLDWQRLPTSRLVLA